MRYISTRGQAPAVSFLDAVLAGLAPDGGLYVPQAWPAPVEISALDPFAMSAARVLQAFAGDALDAAACAALARAAYGADASGRWPEAVTPLVQTGAGEWILELFHGPSLSFKDVAMQLIGPLYDHALTARNARLSVVCATSGDTGGAAVEALRDRERVDLFVLLPKGRVSDVQRLFMTASGAANVHAIEIDGDFDACQSLVKSLFADRDFAARAALSGVNSINWARIVAQSVYFHIAASTLCAAGMVNFVVPTGNFGDAYSGFVARMCGAPIDAIMLATNANDILARAVHTGRYERAPASHATLSPAMDIQVASNFERILFEALDRDGGDVERLYAQFVQSGGFDLPAQAHDFLLNRFYAEAVSDAETEDAMRALWNEGRHGYLACPHTAVALHAPGKAYAMRGDAQLIATPLVTLATAHPAKFPATVERATGVRPALPARCADLFARKETFCSLAAEPEAVKRFIRERSRAWA